MLTELTSDYRFKMIKCPKLIFKAMTMFTDFFSTIPARLRRSILLLVLTIGFVYFTSASIEFDGLKISSFELKVETTRKISTEVLTWILFTYLVILAVRFYLSSAQETLERLHKNETVSEFIRAADSVEKNADEMKEISEVIQENSRKMLQAQDNLLEGSQNVETLLAELETIHSKLVDMGSIASKVQILNLADTILSTITEDYEAYSKYRERLQEWAMASTPSNNDFPEGPEISTYRLPPVSDLKIDSKGLANDVRQVVRQFENLFSELHVQSGTGKNLSTANLDVLNAFAKDLFDMKDAARQIGYQSQNFKNSQIKKTAHNIKIANDKIRWDLRTVNWIAWIAFGVGLFWCWEMLTGDTITRSIAFLNQKIISGVQR